MQGSCGSNVRTGKRRKQLTMDEEATCRTGAHSLELWAGQGRVSAGVSEWTEPTNLSAFQTQGRSSRTTPASSLKYDYCTVQNTY
jgi:hypothetical protein